jgi:hypothetical protein
VEERDEIQLFVARVAVENLVLSGKIEKDVRLPAAIEDEFIQSAYKRFCSSGGGDGDPVAKADLRRMVDQDLGKFPEAGVSQGDSPSIFLGLAEL